MRISDLAKNVFDASKELKAENERHKQEIERLQAILDEANRLYKISLSGLVTDIVQTAEQIISVRGIYDRSGDQISAVRDFIKWLATGECGFYSNPKTQYLGTKNYDRWSSQRWDCEYGMGPTHGSINFAIYLHPDYRKDDVELTPEQKSACIYYLENLESIQSAKKAA